MLVIVRDLKISVSKLQFKTYVGVNMDFTAVGHITAVKPAGRPVFMIMHL